MKRILPLLVLGMLCSTFSTHAQNNVGINNPNPNASALLDLTANNKGFLTPRMSSALRLAIPAPAAGLLVYDLSTASFWHYNGTMWVEIASDVITEIRDRDNDTRINVEQTPDDDLIRFYTRGAQAFQMSRTAQGSFLFEVLNTNRGVFIGDDAGLSATVNAFDNTFIGDDAGRVNNVGDYNTFVGSSTGRTNTAGIHNSFFGFRAGFINVSSYNTFIGSLSGDANSSGSRNTFIGYNSGSTNSNASDNSFIGYNSGFQNTTGLRNTFFGSSSGRANSTGRDNVYLGYYAGERRVSGLYNVAVGSNAAGLSTSASNQTTVGYYAGRNSNAASATFVGCRAGEISNGGGGVFIGYTAGRVSNGSGNTFVGYASGDVNSTGYANTFLGSNTGGNNSTGHHNTFVGDQSGLVNSSGYFNTFLGNTSGRSNNSGLYNTYIGGAAGFSMVSGTSNTFLGESAGYTKNTGSYNVLLGGRSGYSNGSGSSNVMIGYEAGRSNVHGSGNVFIGYRTGYNASGSNQLYIDNNNTAVPLIYGNFATNYLRVGGTLNINNQYSLPLAAGTPGQVLTSNGATTLWTNVSSDLLIDADNDTRIQVEETADDDIIRFDAMGFERLAIIPTSSTNVRFHVTSGSNLNFGYRTGMSITSGIRNSSVGQYSGDALTVGIDNVFFGYAAGTSETSGNSNTIIGSFAGYSQNTGAQNTFIGYRTGYSSLATDYNTFIGAYAGEDNTSGFYNSFFGRHAGANKTGGNNNTLVGQGAGLNSGVGANNLYLGTNSGYNATGSSNIFIGYYSGYTEGGSNKLIIENSSTTTPLIYGDFATNLISVNGGLVVNEWSANSDFRAEGNLEPHLLFVDASDDAVLIGTTSNTLKLMRVGDGTGDGIQLGTFETIEDGGTNSVAVNTNLIPLTDNSWDLGSLTQRWDDVYATNGVIQTSDKRDKRDIEPLTYGLDEVLRLKPVSYFWNNNPKHTEKKIGLIAQDIQQVVPEVVRDWVMIPDEEGSPLGAKVPSDRLGVSYSDLIPVLIKAMQEQQMEIESLKSEVNALKQK